jgi:parallel beta-helix repeat protein
MKKIYIILVVLLAFVALACTNGVASEIALDTKYVGNTMVDLSWDEYGSTDFSKYELCRDGVRIPIKDRTVTFYRDTGLTKGVTYTYEIRVYNATGRLVDTCTTSAKAGDVHGKITIDTSWTAASSPYDLTGNVEVRNGANLTIEKGVMVTTTSVDWGEAILVGDPSALKKGALYADGVSFYDVRVDIIGHAEIKNCFFEDAGISVHDSNNHVITGNTVLNNSDDYGIYLGNSRNNVITDNTVLNNYLAGITLDNSSNNVITNNTVLNNNWASIFLAYNSCNNVITSNTASNNNLTGIHLWYNSCNNVIKGNTISNNNDTGILLDNSSNNKIYNNYFNNTNNAYDNGNNTWTSPTKGPNIVGGPYIGGNYWSDYNGTDSGGDMFGDTELPYNCSGGIKNGGDPHPLITIRSYIVTIANKQVGEHYLWGAEGQIPDDGGGEVIMATPYEEPFVGHEIAHHTAKETTEGSHYCSGRHSEVTRLPHGNPDNKTHQANYRKYSWQR